MLPSSGRSIGERSVTTLPANRSIILADSRFRPVGPNDTPYNFNCDLSGTAVYAKEVFYQKLFWNQPLFAHNNGSCELRFKFTQNAFPLITYVVYVTPFVMFTQYDGNAPGTSFLTPQLYSYANNIEMALNGDVRTIPFNTTLVNRDGLIRDRLHNIVQMRFRYTPSRGFAMYALPNGANHYGIHILPCSFIANAHFVHGMGIYDPSIDPTVYQPHSIPLTTVFSDCAPNLLPTRYVVVQSQELNKDRRLISFHNGNFSSFVNELAIFAVNPIRTSVFHEVGVGDDATVISLRDDYTPQSFRIQILDEHGQVIRADDPLGTLLQTSGIGPATLESYIIGALAGRGNPDFMNYLVFGYQRIYNGVTTVTGGTINIASPYPSSGGMGGADLFSQPIGSQFLIPSDILLNQCVPFIVSTSALTPTPPEATGFSPDTSTNWPFLNNSLLYGVFTKFTWFPGINRFPGVITTSNFLTWVGDANAPSSGFSNGFAQYVFLMFDATTFQVIMTCIEANYNLATSSPPRNFTNFSNTGWSTNPNYNLPSGTLDSLDIGFAFGYTVTQTNGAPYQAHYHNMYGSGGVNTFTIFNPSSQDNLQTEYLPPATDSQHYGFGDPLALALPEEVIHEIAAVLEYN